MPDPILDGPFTNPFGLTNVGSSSTPIFVDINGDGKLDAFVGEKYGKTLFFKNTGTTTAPAFAAAETNPFGLINVGKNSNPTFVDIDGNGTMDAFVGNRSGYTLFFKNTGTTTAPGFATAETNPFGLVAGVFTNVFGYSNPTFVDINGDGILDAFIGEEHGSTLFFKNTGTTTAPAFAAAITDPFGLIDVGAYSNPTFIDIDGDGRLDALIGNGAGDTLFFKNTGTTTVPAFATAITNPFNLANVGFNSHPTVVDIDGDGKLDALIGNSDGNTLFFKNVPITKISSARYDVNSGNLFVLGAGIPVLAGANNDIDVSKLTITGEGGNSYTLTSSNVEIINSYSFTVALNAVDKAAISSIINKKGTQSNGGTTYNLAAAEDWAAGAASALVIADLTGNGITAIAEPVFDIPVTNPFGLTSVVGAFVSNPFGVYDVGAFNKPNVVDIDGDGKLDALIGNKDGNLLFFKNTGTTTAPAFATAVTNPFGLTNVKTYSSPTAVDIDGDGKLDVLIGNKDGNLLFFKNTGTTTAPAFAAAVANPFGLANVGSGSSPTAADIDGDGKLDVLVGNKDGNLLFFKNTGTTTAPAFAAAVANPFGLVNVGSGSSPTAVDIDGDGKLDVLVNNDKGNTLFFRNTGTTIAPAFAAAVTNPFGLTNAGSSSNPTFVDINSDGNIDALIGNRDGNVLFFKNVLTPKISSARYDTNTADLVVFGAGFPILAGSNNDIDVSKLTITGAGANSYTLTTNNVDITDSHSFTVKLNAVDKAAVSSLIDKKGSQSNDETIYNLAAAEDWATDLIGNGITAITDPEFNYPLTNPFGLEKVEAYNSPTFVDIDSNGTLDAFVGGFNGNTVFFKNTGTTSIPAFATGVTNPFGLTNVGTYSSPNLVDIDGDGKLDALIGNSAGNTVFFKNTGTTSLPAFAAGVTNPFGLTNVEKNSTPNLVDIDGDGKLDAFVGNFAGNTLFFKNTGTTSIPAFAPGVTNPFGLSDVGLGSNPTLVDIDGDGKLDALIGNRNGDTLFFRNTGTTSVPAFAAAVTNSFNLLNLGISDKPTFVDINGDGKLDAFIGEKLGNIRFFNNALPLASTIARNDFNGDKKSDILWRSDIGGVALWQMNGATVSAANLTSTPQLDPSWKTAGTGDFNGDKKSDILWRNDSGAVAIWQMNGSPVVSSTLTSTPQLDSSWKTAGTGDFNGDKKSDILWRNDSGAIAIWQMNGSTVVSSTLTSTPSLDSSWKTAGTADFTGDGKSDILWRNDDGSIALWQMSGSTVISSRLTSTPALDGSWKINGTGDFNGDGKADILWRNTNTGAVDIWQMNGSTVTLSSLTSTRSLDSSWTVAGIGDYNGDGKSDILWRKDSGAVDIWTMNGANVLSSNLTSIQPESNSWKIAPPII